MIKKDKFKNLEVKINYNFSSKDLLKRSLVHKSYDENNNNEKLEFLGDRVLGLIISKNLINMFPDEKEGIIDKKFANLVNKKKCAEIAGNIKLNKYMILGENYRNKNQNHEKISGDCLEALIGAIYLDGGLKVVEKFVLNYWSESLNKSFTTIIDSKTKLQEYSLKKYKKLPSYILEKKEGPHHKPIFKVIVYIPYSKKFSAIGKSKKDAQQNAAEKLLKELNI